MTMPHSDSQSNPTHPRSRDSVLTRSISNQAMRHSKSFRALVLFGVVALVTAVYQSITPPSSALTITTGLTPRHSEFKPGPFPLILMRLPAYRESLPEPHPLSVCALWTQPLSMHTPYCQ